MSYQRLHRRRKAWAGMGLRLKRPTLPLSRLRLPRPHVPGFVFAFLNWLIRLIIYYRVEISHKAKCPACGRRDWHKLEWVPHFEKVMHRHTKRTIRHWLFWKHEVGCDAIWGENPVAAAELWRVITPIQGAPEGALPSVVERAVSPTGRPVPINEGHTTTIHQVVR